MPIKPVSQSHPAVRFEQPPVVEGLLSRFGEHRERIMDEVARKTVAQFAQSELDLLLGEALYRERSRLRRFRGNLFTKARGKKDKALWNQVQSGLLKPGTEVDRKGLLKKVARHFVEEIAGRFDPRVYRFATFVVPWGFNWLLNAASVRRFLPWGMTESLQSRLKIVGEVPMLQSLAKRGTILLVPTHQSNIDSVLIGYIIYLLRLPPFAYGAGLNLYSNPILNFFMGNLGAYTVDRQKSNEIYKTTLKHYSTQILQEGIHSIFFPGGGRSRSGAIETRLKLGLLGTGLQAQLANLQAAKPDSSVFVVPLVMSYDFVLEAGSLIEDYLAEAGKHRFIIMDDESWQLTKVLRFFWKLFSSQNGITVRVGRPMDILGNFVDEEGRSLGPNGTIIDPKRWLTTRGELCADEQRDSEYTRELGRRISERFYCENTVLPSQLVAFTFFECLRGRYPDLDLYRFLRLSPQQRSLSYTEFLKFAEQTYQKVVASADRGDFYLSDELKASDTEAWVHEGSKALGLLHEAAVVRIQDGVIWTEDMNLLYYYRNRLSGYGLSRLAGSKGGRRMPGENDEQGFLA